MSLKVKGKPVSYSDINIAEDLAKRFNYNTPDYLLRKQEHTIPVFVYDEFKICGDKNFMLHGMPYLGEARTVMDCFQMEQCSSSGTPMIRKLASATKKTPMGSIWGEAYVIDPITLCEMDKVMGNMTMFTRELHWVWLHEQKNPLVKTRPNMKAWVYMKNDGFWNNRQTISRIPKERNGKKIFEWPMNRPAKTIDPDDIIPWNM